MNCNSVVKFISQSITVSDLGVPVATETTTSEIPCKIEKIGITESYLAQSAGKKPDARIKVHKSEYADQAYFLFDNRRYKVLRTQGDRGFVVIVGELVAVDQVVV